MRRRGSHIGLMLAGAVVIAAGFAVLLLLQVPAPHAVTVQTADDLYRALASARLIVLTHHHADPLESEGIEHREPLPGRGHSPACPSLSHGPPSPACAPDGHVPGASRFRSGGITPDMVRW